MEMLWMEVNKCAVVAVLQITSFKGFNFLRRPDQFVRQLFMFILTRLEDTVKLLPSTEYSHAALLQWLNAKYSNRILHKVGLCISVYDILSVGDGALKYGDGCVYVKSTI